ncbi:MAG: hypothetical protein ACTSRZ_03145 [Promethearchaeota archaeon]
MGNRLKNSKEKKNNYLELKSYIHLENLKIKFYAFSIFAIICVAGVSGIVIYSIATPMVSTSYYHANIQFRAGDEESYYAIMKESLEHILDMYDKHPNWIWTLECQGLLIDIAYKEYPEIFEKIRRQNQRGQLELICPQYSHGLAVAYNYKDFAESIAYNKYLMEDVYNLTISNVIVLQEGQWLPAFPLIKHLGFNTFAISRDQLSYQNYYPHKPLLSYEYDGIGDCYVIPLIWIPCIENGVLHHQLALSDSERTNTGGVEGPYEFNFNEDKMKQIELRHLELEKRGNIWMNMSDWVKFCLKKGNIEKMNKFMPESHWTPSRHENSRWMAWGSGEADDGLVHARNYYTRNLLQSAEIMNENAYAKGWLNLTEYEIIKDKLLEGKIHLWMAQVTDTSGVNPNKKEFEYLINNTAIAQNYAWDVINQIRTKVNWWSGRIQIDSYDRLILNETYSDRFMNITDLNGGASISEQQLENIYGFDLETIYSAEDICPYNISIKRQSIHFSLNNNNSTKFFEYNITKLKFQFMSHRGIYINNTIPQVPAYNDNAECNGQKTEQHIIFYDNWNEVYYSPSLAENFTQRLIRNDYKPPLTESNEHYKVPLMISNGFLYNVQKGYAIITNNTVRHISVRWENDFVEYYEDDQEFNSEYEFIIYQGNLIDAHLLSNIINPYPFMEFE